MKKNPIFTIVKDVLLALIAWGAAYFLINGMWGVDVGGTMEASAAAALAMMFAGVPFGWRWSSKIITATSIKGVGIKLLISVVLGFVAIFVTLIADAVRLVVHLCKSRRPAPAV